MFPIAQFLSDVLQLLQRQSPEIPYLTIPTQKQFAEHVQVVFSKTCYASFLVGAIPNVYYAAILAKWEKEYTPQFHLQKTLTLQEFL